MSSPTFAHQMIRVLFVLCRAPSLSVCARRHGAAAVSKSSRIRKVLLVYMFSRGLWVLQIPPTVQTPSHYMGWRLGVSMWGWNAPAPGLIQDYVQPLFPSQTARVKGVCHSSICRASLSLWMRLRHLAKLIQRRVFKLMRRVLGIARSII